MCEASYRRTSEPEAIFQTLSKEIESVASRSACQESVLLAKKIDRGKEALSQCLNKQRKKADRLRNYRAVLLHKISLEGRISDGS